MTTITLPPNSLKWPNDIGTESYQDFIKIQAYEFITRKRDTTNTDPQSRVPYTPYMYLPIPNSIQFADGISWTTEDLSVIGTDFSEVVKSYFRNRNKPDELVNIVQGVAVGAEPEFALDKLASLQKLGSRNAISQGLANKILNPYTEQIFNGIGLRSFSFNWKLVPRNEDEQYEIYRIIKYLRYYSAPTLNGEGIKDLLPNQLENSNQSENSPISILPPPEKLADRWLSIPKSWKIDFRHKQQGEVEVVDMKFIPRLKYCVITDINVNYTPDGYWSTHYYSKNGDFQNQPAPVAYDLSINFQETDIITTTDILDGY